MQNSRFSDFAGGKLHPQCEVRFSNQPRKRWKISSLEQVDQTDRDDPDITIVRGFQLHFVPQKRKRRGRSYRRRSIVIAPELISSLKISPGKAIYEFNDLKLNSRKITLRTVFGSEEVKQIRIA